MKEIFLFGKEYIDTIMVVDSFSIAETNKCKKVIQQYGGLYNLNELYLPNCNLNYLTSGSKYAYRS